MKEKILLVVANLLEKGKKILLVRERKRTFAGKKIKEKWNFPAGRLGKESLIDCLIRETKEETGFETKPTHLIGIYQYPRVLEFNVIFFIFSSKILGGKFKPSKEIAKIKWFSLKEIENLKKKGQLRGDYILKAIKDYKKKRKIPLRFIKILSQSES
jgi:8-oxo-dGTP pyrophosphatase MutT (NUDIX family)